MSGDRASVAAALPTYEIGVELGRGGWGIVLAGHHRHLRRDVAIKQLPPAFASDAAVRSRFVAEARLLASLDHPHIVPVYDFIERDGLCLLVMEQLSGGTAWSRFTEQGLDPPTACAIGLVTAVALEHAHDRGILHRDIKPENLLFSADGADLKVADFGIAKVLAGSQTMATSAGEVLGTPAYMAPEQATGGEVTRATDLYALGISLYEMLSGRLPFPEGESALAVLYQRVHQAPLPITEAAPELPGPLAEIIMWAISTEPGERPATADAFASALAERATAAFGPGWVDRTGIRAALSGRLAAITERAPARPARQGSGTAVRPDRTTRAVEALPDVGPDALVPVAELTEPGPDGRLRELRLLLGRSDTTDARRLAIEIERAEATAHELKELSLLRRVRSGQVPLSEDDRTEVERLAGGTGSSPAARLGLDPSASDAELRQAAEACMARWKRRGEHPLSSRAVASLATDLVRTCEGLLDALPAPEPPPG